MPKMSRKLLSEDGIQNSCGIIQITQNLPKEVSKPKKKNCIQDDGAGEIPLTSKIGLASTSNIIIEQKTSDSTLKITQTSDNPANFPKDKSTDSWMINIVLTPPMAKPKQKLICKSRNTKQKLRSMLRSMVKNNRNSDCNTSGGTSIRVASSSTKSKVTTNRTHKQSTGGRKKITKSKEFVSDHDSDPALEMDVVSDYSLRSKKNMTVGKKVAEKVIKPSNTIEIKNNIDSATRDDGFSRNYVQINDSPPSNSLAVVIKTTCNSTGSQTTTKPTIKNVQEARVKTYKNLLLSENKQINSNLAIDMKKRLTTSLELQNISAGNKSKDMNGMESSSFTNDEGDFLSSETIENKYLLLNEIYQPKVVLHDVAYTEKLSSKQRRSLLQDYEAHAQLDSENSSQLSAEDMSMRKVMSRNIAIPSLELAEGNDEQLSKKSIFSNRDCEYEKSDLVELKGRKKRTIETQSEDLVPKKLIKPVCSLSSETDWVRQEEDISSPSYDAIQLAIPLDLSIKSSNPLYESNSSLSANHGETCIGEVCSESNVRDNGFGCAVSNVTNLRSSFTKHIDDPVSTKSGNIGRSTTGERIDDKILRKCDIGDHNKMSYEALAAKSSASKYETKQVSLEKSTAKDPISLKVSIPAEYYFNRNLRMYEKANKVIKQTEVVSTMVKLESCTEENEILHGAHESTTITQKSSQRNSITAKYTEIIEKNYVTSTAISTCMIDEVESESIPENADLPTLGESCVIPIENIENDKPDNSVDENGNFTSSSSSSSSSSSLSSSSSSSTSSSSSSSSCSTCSLSSCSECYTSRESTIDVTKATANQCDLIIDEEGQASDSMSLFAESVFSTVDQDANAIDIGNMSPLLDSQPTFDNISRNMIDVDTYFEETVRECNEASNASMQEDKNISKTILQHRFDKDCNRIATRDANINELDLNKQNSTQIIPAAKIYQESVENQQSMAIPKANINQLVLNEQNSKQTLPTVEIIQESTSGRDKIRSKAKAPHAFSREVKYLFSGNCFAKMKRGFCTHKQCQFHHDLTPGLQNLEKNKLSWITEVIDFALSNGFHYFIQFKYPDILTRLNYFELVKLCHKLCNAGLMDESLVVSTFFEVKKLGVTLHKFMSDIARRFNEDNNDLGQCILCALSSCVEAEAYWETFRDLLIRIRPGDLDPLV